MSADDAIAIRLPLLPSVENLHDLIAAGDEKHTMPIDDDGSGVAAWIEWIEAFREPLPGNDGA